MRGSSSRAATAAALIAGLAGLAVAGRLLPTTPSVQRPDTPTSAEVPAGTIRILPLQDVPTSTVRGVRVPNAIGHTLAEAARVMRAAGLRGVATEHDPQLPTAVVVAHEPGAGEVIPPGDVVAFRTRTDVQANASPHWSRLGPGPTNDLYRVVAPYAARQRLSVVVIVPRGIDVQVWLQTGLGKRLSVLGSTRDATTCHPTGGRFRCMVRFGALQGQEPGEWTVSLTKRSFPPATIQVTVTVAPG